MGETRGKHGVGAVLNAGPAQFFSDHGFTRRRLHFFRQSRTLFHIVTFEVERFFLGERVVPFNALVWTTSPEIHELITGEPFPNSPISGVIASHTSLEELRGPGSPCGWEVDTANPDSVTETANDVCNLIGQFALPFLNGLQSLDDVQSLYGGRASNYHAVSIQAAICVIQGQPQAAIDILCEWREVYTIGTPESQLRNRAGVSEFAEKLGLALPPDEFVPVTVQSQLCERLREECQQLTRGFGRYNHAENLYREILTHGPVPAEIEEVYREARRANWPTMSSRQLCRMAKKMCNSATRVSGVEAQNLYNDAHMIFSIVSDRDGVPDAYRELANTAAENAS